jgi:signal peptidase I
MRDEEQVPREPAATEPRESGRGPAEGDGAQRRMVNPGLEQPGGTVPPALREDPVASAGDGAVAPGNGVRASAGGTAADGPGTSGDGVAAAGDGVSRDGVSGSDGVSGGGQPAGNDTAAFTASRHDDPSAGAGDRPATGGGEPPAGSDEPWDDRGEARRRPRRRSFWRELPVLIIVALALALLIKTFAVQAFFIPSSSMENTLDIGDRVLVNKIVYHTRSIHRGDVVVFNGLDSWDPSVPQTPPSNPVRRAIDWVGAAFGVSAGEKDYIKRVIGVPGDHVQCCDAKGRVSVNGVPLTESSYLYPGSAPSATPFSITVPAGRLWVMGDHRAVSYDSRQHLGDPGGGSIPENKIVGRAFMIVWPVDRFRVLPIPTTFEQKALAASGLAGQVTRVAAGAAPAAPAVLGFAGAVPLTVVERRLRMRYRRRRRMGRAGTRGP